MIKIQFKEGEIKDFIHKISEKIENGGIIAFYGDLGTGKTRLTQAIAEDLGIKDFKIKSPTYTYIRRYPEHNFYHIDLYRLEEVDELLLHEINEIAENSKNRIIIEWADRMEEHISKNAHKINLQYVDAETRMILG